MFLKINIVDNSIVVGFFCFAKLKIENYWRKFLFNLAYSFTTCQNTISYYLEVLLTISYFISNAYLDKTSYSLRLKISIVHSSYEHLSYIWVVEIKKNSATGYLLNYLLLLVQQMSLSLPISISPTNLPIYFFHHAPLSLLRQRTRSHTLPRRHGFPASRHDPYLRHTNCSSAHRPLFRRAPLPSPTAHGLRQLVAGNSPTILPVASYRWLSSSMVIRKRMTHVSLML